MSEQPKAIVLRAAGTNCDAEMVRAFRLAGADVELIHLDALIADPAQLERFQLVGFPGGFSYGDDIASGRVFAARIRNRLAGPLCAAADRGVPMIGACNGFQVLVQAGLLPTVDARTTALTENASARFIDRWASVAPAPNTVCIWTQNLWDNDESYADAMRLPVAHGEGQFVVDCDTTLSTLVDNGQVALRYTDDVNGSVDSIAGICDPTGRIFGLMPHPERYLEWTRHPYWTRLDSTVRECTTPGLRMFQNAVEAAVGAGV